MLESLRKAAGSLVGKLILGLLVVAFAVWGITDVLIGATSTAARVAGKEISVPQFRAEFSRLTRIFGISEEDGRKMGLDQMALTNLASNAAMESQAERFGLVASDRQVAEALRANPAFRDVGGQFSREAYQYTLQRNGLRQAEFERDVREGLTRQMLLQAAAEGAAPPRAAVEALEIHEAERRAVSYLKFAVAEEAEPEAPSDEVLTAFHQAEAPLFTAPEIRAADWIALSPATLARPEDVSEADARAAYERLAPGRFSFPERRRVEQILFADEAAARAAALRVKEGETLAAIANEMGRAVSDTQLGLTTRERLPTDLANVVFALAAPGVAEPYEGGFGWTLAGVSEIQPARTTPFEEVRATLATELAAERARARLPAAILEFEDYVAGGSSLAEIARSMNIPDHDLAGVDSTGFDANGVKLTDLPEGYPNFLTALFAAQKGGAPARLDAPGAESGVVFYQVREITPAALKPFADVREEVLRGWTDRQKRESVAAKSKAAEARLAEGATLLQVAADTGLTINEIPAFGRREAPEDLSEALVTRLFSVEKDVPVEGEAKSGDGRVLAVASEIALPTAAEVSTQVENRMREFSEQLQADIGQALTQETLRQGGLTIYPNAVDAAFAAPTMMY